MSKRPNLTPKTPGAKSPEATPAAQENPNGATPGPSPEGAGSPAPVTPTLPETQEQYENQMGAIVLAAKGELVSDAESWPELDTEALRTVVALRKSHDELLDRLSRATDAELEEKPGLAKVRRDDGNLPHPHEVDPAKITKAVLTTGGYVVPTPKPSKADV